MKKIVLLGILLFFISIFVLNRTHRPQRQSNSTTALRVTTSFYPLYFFAHEVGGEYVEVINLTPAGAEPHDYELTAQDVVTIEQSQLLLVNGKLEVWEDKIRSLLQGKSTHILEVGDSLFSQTILNEDGENAIDPHIWLSPILAKNIVERITQTFIELDPQHTQQYQQNALRVQKQLDDLDQIYRQGLQHCQTKDIVTSHAAFGYMAAGYDLRQIPITGISPEEEPSLQQLAEMTRFAKQHNVKVIFFESLVSPKLAETLAKEINAQTLVLNPLEGLTSQEIQEGKTYFTEMEQNLLNIKVALRCQ